MKKRKFGRFAPKFPLFDTIDAKSQANMHFYVFFKFAFYHADFEIKLYKYELLVSFFLKFRVFYCFKNMIFNKRIVRKFVSHLSDSSHMYFF